MGCITLLSHELLRNGIADLNLRDGKRPRDRSAGTVSRRVTSADPGLQSRGAQKAVHGALIRRQPMLSTPVNPTDGHRFDGGAESIADGGAHLFNRGRPPPEGVGNGAGISGFSRGLYLR